MVWFYKWMQKKIYWIEYISSFYYPYLRYSKLVILRVQFGIVTSHPCHFVGKRGGEWHTHISPPYTEIFYHASFCSLNYARLPVASCRPPRNTCEHLQRPILTLRCPCSAEQFPRYAGSVRGAFYRLQSASKYAGHVLDEEKGSPAVYSQIISDSDWEKVQN